MTDGVDAAMQAMQLVDADPVLDRATAEANASNCRQLTTPVLACGKLGDERVGMTSASASASDE